MNISLPEDLKAFVDNRIKTRGYSSTSEYVRDLLRHDEEKTKLERFRTLIQEGIESGPGRPWEEHKAELLTRIEDARRAAAGRTA